MIVVEYFLCLLLFFFFFKQKTAYEMRISDWSSDVCSSDLRMKIMSSHQVLAGFHAVVVRLRYAPDSIKEFYVEASRRDKRMQALKIGRASCRERVCQYV